MATRAERILYYVKGASALDVGCTGHVTQPGSLHWLHGQLQKNFHDIVGIDISSENISNLKDLGYDNIYLASAEDFHVNRKFDNIIAGELIEH